jgi:hypothetical protein
MPVDLAPGPQRRFSPVSHELADDPVLARLDQRSSPAFGRFLDQHAGQRQVGEIEAFDQQGLILRKLERVVSIGSRLNCAADEPAGFVS